MSIQSGPTATHRLRAVDRASRSVVVVLIALVAALVGFSVPAHADELAESYVVAGEVTADGSLSITETITFAGTGPQDLEQRLATTRPEMNYTQLNYEIRDISVTAGGRDLSPVISTDGDYQVIKVDASKAGSDPVVISYTVIGAAVALPHVADRPDLTEVSWRVLQGLNVGVRQASGEISLPAGARTTDINCQAGPPASTVTCGTYASGTFEAPHPRFTDGPRGAGEVVVLTFSLPSSAVAPNQILTQKWTLDRAFSAHGAPLLIALGALLVGAGGLFWLHRARGSDLGGGRPSLVAQFEPVAAGEERFILVEQILPGEVGTLTDERVDPVDLTATVVDLAQRGHLTIVQLPASTPNTPLDWTFERRSGADDDLRAYERTLLGALVPDAGPPVRVSEISSAVEGVVHQVQDEIYDEVVAKGWFAARPDSVRNSWGRAGWAAVIAAVLALIALVSFTDLGLLGLVLVGLAVGLLWVSQQMPRRTAKGTAILGGLQVLAMTLATQPTGQMPKHDTYAEISKVLPYAIVLGGLDRWLDALVAADDDPGVPDPDDLGWYRAPDTWQLSDLPFSVEAFITTLEGKLYTRH